MGKSKIEWTDHTVNCLRVRDKITGAVGHFCLRVSPGCKNCYAARYQPRAHMHDYIAANRDKVEPFLDHEILKDVLRRRKPTRFFWCSMTDMFLDPEFYPWPWLDKMFATMALTSWHQHMVLTKHPDHMRAYMTMERWANRIHPAMTVMAGEMTNRWVSRTAGQHLQNLAAWPLDNVELGVSVENQDYAAWRLYLLAQTAAETSFCSYEPALGPVDFTSIAVPTFGYTFNALNGHVYDERNRVVDRLLPLDQIIIGGESGPGARAFDLGWARHVIEQVKPYDTKIFVKQLGAKPLEEFAPNCDHFLNLHSHKGNDMEEWPQDLRRRESV